MQWLNRFRWPLREKMICRHLCGGGGAAPRDVVGAALARRSGGGLRLNRAAGRWVALAGDTSVTRLLASVTDLVMERTNILTMLAVVAARAGLASRWCCALERPRRWSWRWSS